MKDEKRCETLSEFYRLERNVPLALYRSKEKNERSKVAILAMHGQDYLSFPPMVALASFGFVAAGANPSRRSHKDDMLDIKTALTFLKAYPGVEKVVLMGHSNGGCLLSSYEYIAENGTSRFRETERLVPFPEIEPLTPADGLMLLDANYGIMDMLAMDPAIKSLHSGYERIPELDIYNPENGYVPGGCRYPRDFVKRFQQAQVKFYRDILARAQQMAEDMRLGKACFMDDMPLVIPGAGTGSSSNKLFNQDNSLLGHTRKALPLLKKGGEIENTVIQTVRVMTDAPDSRLYRRGAMTRTVRQLLENELRFDDFGYDECSIWGADWNFNPMSTQANVKGIHIPLLLEGNTGSIEFINTEYNYDNAVSPDKTVVFLEGADHMFQPVRPSETMPGEFGDTQDTFVRYMAQWLSEPGRFLG